MVSGEIIPSAPEKKIGEHTNELDSGACSLEPDSAYPFGGFKYLHSHGDNLHFPQLRHRNPAG
ncbi:hypothetical protein G7A66_07215 [Altererythrobacter sp. SALINAS58]|uniref:hypothetical protein n=1 Tax=Alteripontixanthobacter muriae TaxID=2705546 RepID=UPI0015754DB7|nr:hypothetical protein [Alteripontixanthobacter muriae]NTZ42879.1 hypothetical protein [Alteripontixanthobacter muriae]